MSDLSPLVRLTVHEDSRGRLVSIEGAVDVPFKIARVFYILPGDGSARGFHAHRGLRQLMVCASGSCRIILDDANTRREYSLDRPDEAVLVDRMVWGEIHDLSSDAVLLVLASNPYDESDYIRDYGEFVLLRSGSLDGR